MYLTTSRILSSLLLIILALPHFAMAEGGTPSFFETGAGALEQTPEFLPVDQAFEFSAWPEGNHIKLHWQITEGHYLYKHRFKMHLANGKALDAENMAIPPGKPKDDEYFGRVEVYYKPVTANLSLLAQQLTANGHVAEVQYQGCAEAGLCYPPQKRFISIEKGIIQISHEAPTAAPIGRPSPAPAPPQTEEQHFFQILDSAGLFTIAAFFYVAGLALAFTPCVLPMVPILSSIIAGQGAQASKGRLLSLTLVYVLAMSVTYAVAGALTGYFGAELNLQIKLQSPAMLAAFAALFVLFSLSMFGLYEIRLPQALQDRLSAVGDKQQGGQLWGVAAMGVLSSLVVSPCVSAPLAGALVYIGAAGDPLLGGLALLSLGLGMGSPLILIGLLGAQVLPKAGAWMIQVKVFFGVMLLGLALWMLDRVLNEQLILVLWAALALGYGLYLGAHKLLSSLNPLKAAPLIGVLLSAYGGWIILGGFTDADTPWLPTYRSESSENSVLARFVAVQNQSDLERLLKEAEATGQPLMLDIYADWCVSCHVLEQEVFTEESVAKVLGQFTLARADITDNKAEHSQLLKQYNLFGPPGLLFFLPNRGELKGYRIQGEIKANALYKHLQAILSLQRPAPNRG